MSTHHNINKLLNNELTKSLKNKDEWLLVHIDYTKTGVSFGIDSVFKGYENKRELRDPRWRTLVSAKEHQDIGFKWIIAGKLSMAILLRELQNKTDISGVIMHRKAVLKWLPDCAVATPVINSVKGFVNPNNKKHIGLGKRRPGRSTRENMKLQPCYFCNNSNDLTLHHLIKREFGGATEKDNLLVVCNDCHVKIHNGIINDTDLILEVHLKRARNLINEIK